MVLLAVSQYSKCHLFFVQEGSKIYRQTYKRLLEYDVIADIDMHMAAKECPRLWWWQQDWAPSRGHGDVGKLPANKHMAPRVFEWILKGANASPLVSRF